MWQNPRNSVLRKLHLCESKVSWGHKEWTEANLRLHLSCCTRKWGKILCGVRTGVHDWMCLHSILLLSVHQEQISVVGSLSHFPNRGVILWSGLNFSEKFVIYPFFLFPPWPWNVWSHSVTQLGKDWIHTHKFTTTGERSCWQSFVV